MNIAIFGGSFDPPHIAHETIVYKSLEILDIDRLFVVPTYLNPFKNEFFLDEQTRFNLMQKLFEDEKRVFVEDFEVREKRAVATIETIEYLQNKLNPNRIYLIVGEDNLEKLHLWSEFEKLKKIVTFCVFTRKDFTNNSYDFKKIELDCNISSTKIRESLDFSKIPTKIEKDIKNLIKGKKIEQKS